MPRPASIDVLIERADRWLKAHRPDYYARLQPGTTAESLANFESHFSLQLPEAFRKFYRWRNGQERNCFESLQSNLMLSSLEDIAQTKEMLDNMIGTDFEKPMWWRRGWVPFLSNGGGDHLCIDVAAEGGGTPGQVLMFWHDAADRSISFPHIDAWLSELVGSMEAGKLKVI